MKITMEHVKRVLDYIKPGICYGFGEGKRPGDMCVMHAVQRATDTNQYGEYDHTDQPVCVHGALAGIAIGLNDCRLWASPAARADGPRRFAIASMGTATFTKEQMKDFNDRASKVARAVLCLNGFDAHPQIERDDNHRRMGVFVRNHVRGTDLASKIMTEFADGCASILADMKSEGSIYLCLIRDDKEQK